MVQLMPMRIDYAQDKVKTSDECSRMNCTFMGVYRRCPAVFVADKSLSSLETEKFECDPPLKWNII